MRTRILAIGLMLLACVSCGRGRSRSSFADVVAGATLIQLKHPPDRLFPEGVSLARFHLRYDPYVFSALSSARPADRPPIASASFKIVMWENERAHGVYDYEPTTGSIHFGEEWLQVPEDLRQRFQKLIADYLKAHPPKREGYH